MADVLENAEADLTPQMRNLINMLWDEWKLIEQPIEKLNLELNGSLLQMQDARGYDRSQG